ncbi:hypothetical protein Tco_1343563 [Tanacetum coccineum]
MKLWKRYYFHKFTVSSYYGKVETMRRSLGCDGEIDDMLRIKLREAESNEEIFTSVVWIIAFNIKEPIYVELCHKFYSTYEFDEVCFDDELQTKKIIKFRLGGCAHNLNLLEFARTLGLYHVDKLEEAYVTPKWVRECGLVDCEVDEEKKSWYSKGESDLLDLDTTTPRELIDSEGSLILKDPHSGMPRVGIPRPPRASMQDLYKRMGNMEIRQGVIERMSYRQSYHWDRYAGVFEHMARVYSVDFQGAYNPPGYAQP